MKISEFWQQANSPGGLSHHLLALNDGNIEGLLGVCVSTDAMPPLMDYWIAVDSSHSADVTHLEIPAAKWL